MNACTFVELVVFTPRTILHSHPTAETSTAFNLVTSTQAEIATRDDSSRRLEEMCEHLEAQVSL